MNNVICNWITLKLYLIFLPCLCTFLFACMFVTARDMCSVIFYWIKRQIVLDLSFISRDNRIQRCNTIGNTGIYIYMCVCVCVCIKKEKERVRERDGERKREHYNFYDSIEILPFSWVRKISLTTIDCMFHRFYMHACRNEGTCMHVDVC